MRFLLNVSAGLLLWAVSFSLLYAVQGASCALRWNEINLTPFGTMSGLILTMLWGVSIGISALIIRWAIRLGPGLERQLALSSAIIGCVAIIITGSPVLTTSACVG